MGFFVAIVSDTLADDPRDFFFLFLIEAFAELALLVVEERHFQVADSFKPFTLAGFGSDYHHRRRMQQACHGVDSFV